VASRRKFLREVADTGTLILPIHFPSSTVGQVTGMPSGSATRSCAE